MKLIIRLSLAVVIMASFTACQKIVLVSDDNALTGTWVLTDVSEKDAYGWYTVTTGLEGGTFTLYGNGSARYEDRYGVLTGNWQIYTTTSGYYDQYGNYYRDSHQAMEIHLSDYYSDSYVDLYFDDVAVYNGSFVATTYNDGYIDRYHFSRY